jgi:hypothetical protein
MNFIEENVSIIKCYVLNWSTYKLLMIYINIKINIEY